jgi:hypothetical protein
LLGPCPRGRLLLWHDTRGNQEEDEPTNVAHEEHVRKDLVTDFAQLAKDNAKATLPNAQEQGKDEEDKPKNTRATVFLQDCF